MPYRINCKFCLCLRHLFHIQRLIILMGRCVQIRYAKANQSERSSHHDFQQQGMGHIVDSVRKLCCTMQLH